MAFWFAYLLYAGGFVRFAYLLFSRRELHERLGLACVTAGWLLETVALAARGPKPAVCRSWAATSRSSWWPGR